MKKMVSPGWALYALAGIIIFLGGLFAGVIFPCIRGEAMTGLQWAIFVEMVVFTVVAAYLGSVFGRYYLIAADGLTIWYLFVIRKHYAWEELKILDIYEEKNGIKYIRCLPETTDIPAGRYGFRHPMKGICIRHNPETVKEMIRYARKFSFTVHKRG